MKHCTKCGAYNSDERTFCVDCSEKLGDPLSTHDEQQLRDSVNSNIDRLYNRKDPLYVSKFDKVMGVTALIAALCSLVTMIVGWLTSQPFEYLWVALLFFLLTAVEALVPRVMWELEKVRLIFFVDYADDAEPSTFYLFSRKVVIVLFMAIGMLVLAESYIQRL